MNYKGICIDKKDQNYEMILIYQVLSDYPIHTSLWWNDMETLYLKKLFNKQW